MDIHNYERRYKSAIKRVEEAKISARNKELILSFVNALILENLSKPRLAKYLEIMKLVAVALKKDLDKATEHDLKVFVSKIQQRSDYSPWTKQVYKVMIRRFYKWQKGVKGKNKYPELVDWINIRISRSEKRLPSEGDLLLEEDIQKLITTADHPRDKALISMLWESGARIGELGNLSLKNVVFDKHGVVISVRGKTGSRKIRLVASTPYLSTWINNHPFKKDKNSPLWINVGTTNRNKVMNYGTIRMRLCRLFAKAEIQKKHNPHLFRHSRATFMANHLTEFQMNQYFGWIQGSDMPATYVHMSGREVDQAILAMNGIKEDKEKQESKLQPQICVRCDTINSADFQHCSKCGGILDVKYVGELERKEEVRGKSDSIMDKLFQDEEFQKMFMEKVKELKQINAYHQEENTKTNNEQKNNIKQEKKKKKKD